jgi:hypothetical protein
MDNQEKLSTEVTQDEGNNAICIGHQRKQTQILNLVETIYKQIVNNSNTFFCDCGGLT